MLSKAIRRVLGSGLASNDVAKLIADEIENNIVTKIIATNVSTTIDFGVIKVGDVCETVSTDGATGAKFGLATVDGTLPFAAIVGDLYKISKP